jgi:branched-chain amino acid transport system permease protein
VRTFRDGARYLPAAGFLSIALASLIVPIASGNSYILEVASVMGISVILALSLNLLYGYTGQLSFATGAFLGIGAYTATILTTVVGLPFLVSLIPAIVIPGLVAYVVGLPTLQLRGNYLAIGTLAVQLAITAFFQQASSLTGGTLGIFGMQRPTMLGISFASDGAYYVLISVSAIGCYILASRIVSSRWGRAASAVGTDDIAASAMGMNPTHYKVMMFSLTSMMAGLAGALFAYQLLFISPVSFDINESIVVLAMVVVGGVRSNPGAVVGAAVITIVQQVLFGAGQFEFLLFGLFIIATLVFAPRGLVGVVGTVARTAHRLASKSVAPRVGRHV